MHALVTAIDVNSISSSLTRCRKHWGFVNRIMIDLFVMLDLLDSLDTVDKVQKYASILVSNKYEVN